jgi:hypothetical protein
MQGDNIDSARHLARTLVYRFRRNVCIQIGNSDDKLTQKEWSDFCAEVVSACGDCGVVHFSGGPSTHMPWQNFCVCVEIAFYNIAVLKQNIACIRKRYGQDSVAWLVGKVEFI